MRVLIIPDKFKGTLTAQQAAQAMAEGWRQKRPGDLLDLAPMSDGGDGFGEILGELLEAEVRTAEVLNAAHESIHATWWWSESRQTAIVESAGVIGLAMLPAGRHHPFDLDTLGLGLLLRQISSEHSAPKVMIGIGGSATNDAGFGLARGLGYRFTDSIGSVIDRWTGLDRLFRIERPKSPVVFSQVTIACDVQNRLLGPEGASRVYGPQKGLRPEDLPVADLCFERLIETVRRDLQMECAEEPGTGAAGGLGYGLRAFMNGRFRPGFDIFADAAGLTERIAKADLVLTGEGAIDRQTQMGKGTGAIAKLAAAARKPCVGLAGSISEERVGDLFKFVLGIAPKLATPDEAKRDAARWLARLSAEAAAQF